MSIEQLPLICEVCGQRIADGISQFWTPSNVNEFQGRDYMITCVCCEEVANRFVLMATRYLLVLPPPSGRGSQRETPSPSLGACIP